MSTLKIIDHLSGEQIPLEMIELCSTNPNIMKDQWYTELQVSNHESTKIIPIEHAVDPEYQVYALIDDGRSGGSVWFPVTVTRSKQT